ncbi:MAG: hypothetical protein ACLTS6_09105 [Anaerobutyricum sp.]
MVFNVLTEPWMGVVDKETGEVLKVGLRDYIVNAHMYKCSAENKDFAIVRRLQQRLAEAVVIDIYGRRVNDELMSAFNNGRFDADKVDAYFDECIKMERHLTCLMKKSHSCRLMQKLQKMYLGKIVLRQFLQLMQSNVEETIKYFFSMWMLMITLKILGK